MTKIKKKALILLVGIVFLPCCVANSYSRPCTNIKLKQNGDYAYFLSKSGICITLPPDTYEITSRLNFHLWDIKNNKQIMNKQLIEISGDSTFVQCKLSPSGSILAFSETHELGKTSLYIKRLKSGAARKIFSGRLKEFTWLLNKLIFITEKITPQRNSHFNKYKYSVCRYDFQTKKCTVIKVIEGNHSRTIKLSPNGSFLAYEKEFAKSVIMNLENGEPVKIIETGNVRWYNWSEDSKILAIVYRRKKSKSICFFATFHIKDKTVCKSYIKYNDNQSVRSSTILSKQFIIVEKYGNSKTTYFCLDLINNTILRFPRQFLLNKGEIITAVSKNPDKYNEAIVETWILIDSKIVSIKAYSWDLCKNKLKLLSKYETRNNKLRSEVYNLKNDCFIFFHCPTSKVWEFEIKGVVGVPVGVQEAEGLKKAKE